MAPLGFSSRERVRAEMFLDTFERYFQWKQPGM